MNDPNGVEPSRPVVNTDNLFWGILLMGMGTLFLLERLHIANIHNVTRNFWPLFLVAIGVSKLFKRGDAWSGFTLISIGVWLQLVTLNAFDLTWATSWPLLLMILGGGMVLRAVFEGARRSHHRSSTETPTEARHDG